MNGIGRLEFGVGFQKVAQQDKCDDEGRPVKEDVLGFTHKGWKETEDG